MAMPEQKPGKSKQDYATPIDFIKAVEERFGEMEVDLAATKENRKARIFITPEENSFEVDWGKYRDRNCWLNPPFADIDPWAERCAFYASKFRTGRIVLLTPASIGSNWFEKHVHRQAYVLGIAPRITFVGETHPYPKDCMLSVYGGGYSGFDVWRWR